MWKWLQIDWCFLCCFCSVRRSSSNACQEPDNLSSRGVTRSTYRLLVCLLRWYLWHGTSSSAAYNICMCDPWCYEVDWILTSWWIALTRISETMLEYFEPRHRTPTSISFVTCKKRQEYTYNIYIYVILYMNNTCIYLIHDTSTTFPPCAIHDWTNLWTIWLWGPTLRWGLQAVRLERSMASWTQTDRLNHQIYQPQKSLFT